MRKDELIRKWAEYKTNLKNYDSYLDGISYSPIRINYWISEKDYVDDIKENFFFLPQKINFLTIQEISTPPEPPNIDEVPNEPEVSFINAIDFKRIDLSTSDFIDELRDYKNKIEKKRNNIIEKFSKIFYEELNNYKNLKEEITNPSVTTNINLLKRAESEIFLPIKLRNGIKFDIDTENKILLITFQFPDFSNLEIVLDEWKNPPKLLSSSIKKKYIKNTLYSLIILHAYIGAKYNLNNFYDSVVVNVEQNWTDAATGQFRNGIIASLLAATTDLLSLNIDRLEPEACFKHLKGISVQSLDKLSPIRPIFILNKVDDRFIEGKNIESDLPIDSNLAAMPWEDFEHLVAQLFEWEFSRDGIEVKVTRSSRDRGVDAILFDPNPIRGGKYVLQAKRYTRTVDVSAVRDLYGTVMNEGANRGILITTATFGPDAYEFSKDKPISLIDGANLLLMLQKHGKMFRIDLEEARNLNI